MTEDTRDTCSPYPPPGPDGWPVGFAPRWRTEAVVALARGIDAGGKHDRLPVLADALEEAGCDLPEVLHHCRGCTRHDPQCWVVNLALGRPPVPPARYDAVRMALLRREEERRAGWAAPPVRRRSAVTPGFRTALLLLAAGLAAVGGFRGLAQESPARSRTDPSGWHDATDSLHQHRELLKNLDRAAAGRGVGPTAVPSAPGP